MASRWQRGDGHGGPELTCMTSLPAEWAVMDGLLRAAGLGSAHSETEKRTVGRTGALL